VSFYLRKSIGLGPMRVSVSTRGLGASIGVPGLRVGAGPRGAYVSLAGGTVRYRSTTRSRAHSRPQVGSTGPAPTVHSSVSDVVLSDISGATTLEMADTDASDLVRQLNAAAASWPIWPFALVATVVLAALSPWLFILGLPVTLWVAWKDIVRRRVVAFYEVHDSDEQRYQALVDAFATAQRANNAWHVIESGTLTVGYQRKVNAGASSLVNRLALSRTLDGPRHLRTNIAVPSMSTPRRSVHLLPDRVLVRDGNHYASVPYPELTTQVAAQRFIEEGPVPRDSRVLGYTWRFVNKSGGPDRRFNNNRQLPVLEYGRLVLAGANGYGAVLDFSTPAASSALAAALRTMATPPAAPVAPPRPAAPVDPVEPPAARRPAVVSHVRRSAHAAPAAPTTGTAGTPRDTTHAGRHQRVDPPVDLDAVLAAPAPQSQAPHLRRRRLSADGRLAVVGESRYQRTLAHAARGVVVHPGLENCPEVTALVVPEPDNPIDRNAVRVDVLVDGGTATAGHLARDVAPRYQSALLDLADRGFVGTCPARITGGGPGRSYGLFLHLNGAEDLIVENLTDDIELAEPARLVTVTREEDHQDVLAAFGPGARPCTRVAATLRSSTVTRGKYRGAYGIEVLLDGRRVGELTAAMSNRYRDLVVASETHGGRLACEALVTHGERGFQIDLRLPQAN
jgi:hypothetical protein